MDSSYLQTTLSKILAEKAEVLKVLNILINCNNIAKTIKGKIKIVIFKMMIETFNTRLYHSLNLFHVFRNVTSSSCFNKSLRR
jgi:hypothetical protein